jgi:hypothetical protein
MSETWQYQIRIYLADHFAKMARHDPDTEAEDRGTQDYPLYRWTKATVEDPAKKAKYLESFTVYVGGAEVYAKEAADALEADLVPLLGGALITRMSKHDTNPARNPQAPAQYRD